MSHDTLFLVPSSYIYVLGTYKFIAGIHKEMGTQGKERKGGISGGER